MNWRAALFSGVLAAGLTLTLVPRAAGNPPPSAGAWRYAKHGGDGDHDRDDRGYSRYAHGGWDHHSRYGSYDWDRYRNGNGDHGWPDYSSHRRSDWDNDSRYGQYDRRYWDTHRHGDGDHDLDDQPHGRYRSRDWGDDGRFGHYDRGYSGGYRSYRGYDPGYSKIVGRINYDRAKIAEIDPRKHPKALQWYRDDLRNAERDLWNYRYQPSSSTYDPSDYPSGGYTDPYYGTASDPSFDWKHDWPLFLSGLISSQVQR